ncbi:1-deoxy-D-xylulose-5-phosphate synthase [Streptomyces sp. NPDC048384]|uniref:1-deoxy-D-xylulose-5-phosphate synthase n=1 Tax=Streptomyces sp. NPDC048384 TaxID=3155487 RepID=UPI00342F903C
MTTTSAPVQDGYPLLSGISGPEALRALSEADLDRLAGEVRAFLIETVCTSGGHLGPNLGVVELTLALHRVFDSPRDTIVFDTGHQAYVHKLLTGRQKGFERLRQPGGLSGYPSRAESVHDLVENSHASTALSYADGLAKARQLTGEQDRAVVAVVGDGALTGGMCWEALNNLGAAPDRPVIVVLNDNGRSYAPTTGALAGHMAALRRDAGLRERNVFTMLGFAYLGPVDGHDERAVRDALRTARDARQPVVVHVVTVKGKGYLPAEADTADCLHAVAPRAAAGGGVSWTKVFAVELARLAGERPQVVAVTASMLCPTGLNVMAEQFPDRVFDVGIAEQHAVTSAAGLARGGMHPVVAIYATFLTRALDQVLMDVALHREAVTFVLDRAGITGPDGPSHHGMWDIPALAIMPGVRIAAPRDADRLRELLHVLVACDGPGVLRLPKATVGPPVGAVARMDGMDILHRSLRRALDVLIVAAGPLCAEAVKAAGELEEFGIGSTVIDPRFLVPVNEALPAMAARHQLVVTVEDGVRAGGFGAHVAQACHDQAVTTRILNLGLPRRFLPHADRNVLLERCGLSAEGIVKAVLCARSCRQAPTTGAAR